MIIKSGPVRQSLTLRFEGQESDRHAHALQSLLMKACPRGKFSCAIGDTSLTIEIVNEGVAGPEEHKGIR